MFSWFIKIDKLNIKEKTVFTSSNYPSNNISFKCLPNANRGIPKPKIISAATAKIVNMLTPEEFLAKETRKIVQQLSECQYSQIPHLIIKHCAVTNGYRDTTLKAQKAFTLSPESCAKLGDSYRQMASALFQIGEYREAANFYGLALTNLRKSAKADDAILMDIYSNYAAASKKCGKYEIASNCYENAHKIKARTTGQTGFTKDDLPMLADYTTCLEYILDYRNLIKILPQRIALLKQYDSNSPELPRAYVTLGKSLFAVTKSSNPNKENNYTQALAAFDEAISILEKKGNTNLELIAPLEGKANIYIWMRDIDKFSETKQRVNEIRKASTPAPRKKKSQTNPKTDPYFVKYNKPF